MTKEELKSLKNASALWSNNCGVCEECARAFGDGKFTIDPRDVFELVVMIEELDKEIKILELEKIRILAGDK